MNRFQTRKNKDRLDRIIGQNIRAERELRKMTREELAEILDLTVSHMGLIERGERGATAVTLEKLSNIFDVPVDTFFSEADDSSTLQNEDDKNVLSANRLKITSLIARLNEYETEFLIEIIKGLISLTQTRNTDDDYKDK